MTKTCALILLAAPMVISTPIRAADAAHTIMQKGRAFRPGEVGIGRGESLTFTNNDDFIHQVYVQAPNFAFDTEEKNPGQNITQTFTAAGTFEVRCHIHPRMKLVVRVR